MFHGARALPERRRVLVDARDRAAAGHDDDLRQRRDRLRAPARRACRSPRRAARRRSRRSSSSACPSGCRGVEQLLHRDVRHRLHQVDAGGPNSRSGWNATSPSSTGPGVAAHDADHRLAAHRLGHEVLGRRGDEREAAADLVGRVAHEVAVEAQRARRPSRPGRSACRRARSGRAGAARRWNAVTMPKLPPPPRSPQNRSGFSSSDARHDAPVGGDDLGLDQVVADEAELALEPAAAAAEREPGDAGGRHPPAGDGEAVLLRRGVELAPRQRRRRRRRRAARGRRRRPSCRAGRRRCRRRTRPSR